MGGGPGAAGGASWGVSLRLRLWEVARGRQRCHPRTRSSRPRGSAAGVIQPRRDGAPFGSLRMPSPDEGTAPRFSHFGVLRSVPSRPLSWGPRHSHAVTAPHPGLRPRHRREKPVSLGDMHGFRILVEAGAPRP